MPDIKRGMNSGLAMTLHISICTLILIVIVARLVRRLAHPVAPECSLAPWQRLTSEAVHWLLYVLVLATTVSGWLFASARGWTISWFYMVPHCEWTLLILNGVHVASALLHLLYYRDGVMQRMLPQAPAT